MRSAAPERPEAGSPAAAGEAGHPADEAKRPERICPNCGRVLLERKCKLLCPSLECGYYMSCSDFY